MKNELDTLEAGYPGMAGLRKRKPKAPVTIIVGLICKDSIVLASDSQTTAGTAKSEDATKISELELRDARALVAQSGSVILSARAVEILEKLAKDKALTDYRTVADLAQRAMQLLKQELRAQNCDCSMEELHEIIRRQEWECELMLAYYFDGKPNLFTIRLDVGIANKIPKHYAAIGCGGNLARYLLSEHSESGTERDYAYAIALYVVENVKRHDAFCGGPTRIASISQYLHAPPDCQHFVTFMPQEDVNQTTALIMEVESSSKKERNEIFNRRMSDMARQQIAALLEAFDESEPNDPAHPSALPGASGLPQV